VLAELPGDGEYDLRWRRRARMTNRPTCVAEAPIVIPPDRAERYGLQLAVLLGRGQFAACHETTET